MIDTTRGRLHRHENGTEHRHFQEGFSIGGQVVADRDGSHDHSHGTVTLGGGGKIKPRSGAVVWVEDAARE